MHDRHESIQWYVPNICLYVYCYLHVLCISNSLWFICNAESGPWSLTRPQPWMATIICNSEHRDKSTIWQSWSKLYLALRSSRSLVWILTLLSAIAAQHTFANHSRKQFSDPVGYTDPQLLANTCWLRLLPVSMLPCWLFCTCCAPEPSSCLVVVAWAIVQFCLLLWTCSCIRAGVSEQTGVRWCGRRCGCYECESSIGASAWTRGADAYEISLAPAYCGSQGGDPVYE